MGQAPSEVSFCVAVVDSDDQERSRLEKMIQRISLPATTGLVSPLSLLGASSDSNTIRFRTASFASIAALETALTSNSYGIAVIDLRPGNSADSITAVQRLFPDGSDCRIIYITDIEDYDARIYETEHTYCLIRPLDDDEITAALTRAVLQLTGQAGLPIIVPSGNIMYVLDPGEIRYIESNLRVLHIHARMTVTLYATITQFGALLPGYFLQCHKSFLVNMKFVKVATRDRIILLTGESIPISQRRRNNVRQHLHAFIRGI